MKRAIITGGTGMIGIALIQRLLEENVYATVIIRPGSPRAYRIPKAKNVQIIECDLKDILSLKNFIKEQYDYFFHLAWDGTYGDLRNNMYVQNENIRSSLDAVKLAAFLKCKVFLGAGSQAEYGRVSGKISPCTPVNPENGYGIAKLCAGKMTHIMCEKYGIRHVWMRILSVYGENDGAHTMVMSGIYKMLENKRPQYTKGEQMWDYLYCKDAAEAFYLAAEKGKQSAVYCLGSGKVRRLADYIKDICDVVSPGCEIGFGEIPYYENQVMYLCADITKLKEDTGFLPKTEFKEGIQNTVKWVREEMKHEKN